MVNRVLLPRELRIGAGASAQLGDLLRSRELRHPLVVTDRFMVESGVADRLLGSLDGDLTYEVFSDVVPDPTTDCVDQVATRIRDGAFDCVIGFGGGSSLDTAKAAALVGRTGRPMRDYRAPAVTDGGSLPVVAVPTTAGSGSECTQFTVITDSDSHEKMLCAGPAFLPVIAVVDFELTMSMPRRLTADTGLDALTHALEAYVSRKANPFSDGLAIAAMGRLYRNIRRAYQDPDDREARAEMMLGATQAGIAFSNSSVALVHGMSRPIGGHFSVAHGLSNAMLLPTITEFSIPSSPERYAAAAGAMGIVDPHDSTAAACRQLVEALHQLNDDLAVPAPSACHISEKDWFSQLPTLATQALASGSPANNPRVPTQEEIESLYRLIWR